MKKSIALAAVLVMILAGMSGCGQRMNRYQTYYLDLFDTVTSIVGYAPAEAAFREEAEKIYRGLNRFHQLFDIYHEYPNLVNLCTINAHPGETLAVDPEIIALLQFAREIGDASGGRMDVTAGALLSLWHDARQKAAGQPEEAALPSAEALAAASSHRGFDGVEIDAERSTVRITDPLLRLDLGAVAKGYAVERVARETPEGYLISVGGNVCATGPKADGSAWNIGIQDPDGDQSTYLHTISLARGAAVTSGDYERFYMVDGKRYHHIIDPETGYPGDRWRAVTIVGTDSAVADALSTALFLLPLEEGQALLARCGAEAVWMDRDRQLYYSPGYEQYIRK